MSRPIFVVDDESSIRETLRDVLQDEGYQATTFANPTDFFHALQASTPSLILLDIWLPGANGIEILGTIKQDYPEVPVIMMSGHAGIETAVQTIKLGAFDFLEKPVQLNALLDKVHHALNIETRGGPVGYVSDMSPEIIPRGAAGLPGEAISVVGSKQRTIGKDVVLNGTGLLSGRDTGMILTPLPEGSGILFRSLNGDTIQGHITSLENFHSILSGGGFAANSTVLSSGKARIRTVEHILAVLHMYEISNLLIRVDEEIPNIDGSALDFIKLVEEAGVVEQSAEAKRIVIQQRIVIGDETTDQKYLVAEPFDGFQIEMRINYPEPIGEESYNFSSVDNSFNKEIAPARSFNTLENIGMAQQMGKAGKGLINSHIILHGDKVINTELRFPDEFVRHKILDLIGDLYLLGAPVRGRFVANMTSHGYNQALARRIYESLQLSG